MKHVDWKSKIRFENVGWKMSKVTFQLSLSPDTARYTGSQTTRQESKTYCASNGRIQLPNRMNFGKLYCKFLIMDMVAFMQGGIGQIVSVNISWYHLLSVNINIIVEKKHTLNPEVILLFIKFMLKKPCLKFPKSAI